MSNPAMADPEAFFVDLHAMPCTNRCRHCWAGGSREHGCAPPEQVTSVLEKLADLRPRIPQLGFFLYDEPTVHPQFIEIVERAAALGLLGEGCFLPTNGSVLAGAPDEVWERLKAAGVGWLQLTAYGLERTHDSFAGRRGAFRDVVATIRRAEEHGLGWWAGVILHEGNVSEVRETVSHLKGLAAKGEANVGWFPFLWQGRGREASRVRLADYERLPAEESARATAFVTEAEAVRRILDDAELSAKPATEPVCKVLTFQVDRELDVFCGGSCDSGGIAAAVPELRDAFRLGALGDGGFLPLLESYRAASPPALRALAGVTWGDLAERHGDRDNDEIYFMNDLPAHKWAAAHLLATL